VSENRARYPIAVMCRVLGVSPSGYYAWAKRPASERAVMDAALIVTIRAAHAASKGTYGAPRLQVDLADAGIRVGRKRVARLMLSAGLAGVSRRRHTVTTVRDGARQAPDLVDRDFTAERPNMLWVADITYIPTWAGFLYLAVVLDAFSRRIVGWSMATTLHTQVVLDALDMALGQRRPSGVIHHSDQSSHYTSIAFVRRLLFAPRWGRSETPTIMRWRRVSSPRSNVSCSIGADSRRRPRRASPSSNSSRASTIRDGGTHRLGISPRSTTSAATTRERLIPAHTIVPPCSGPSRCGLEMSEHVSTPARRPTLTAPARAGVRDVRAGTEKRTPQGPNRKTAVNRRTRCRHFRYLEPKPSPLHETGASPGRSQHRGSLSAPLMRS
jgi:putative transposase